MELVPTCSMELLPGCALTLHLRSERNPARVVMVPDEPPPIHRAYANSPRESNLPVCLQRYQAHPANHRANGIPRPIPRCPVCRRAVAVRAKRSHGKGGKGKKKKKKERNETLPAWQFKVCLTPRPPSQTATGGPHSNCGRASCS